MTVRLGLKYGRTRPLSPGRYATALNARYVVIIDTTDVCNRIVVQANKCMPGQLLTCELGGRNPPPPLWQIDHPLQAFRQNWLVDYFLLFYGR